MGELCSHEMSHWSSFYFPGSVMGRALKYPFFFSFFLVNLFPYIMTSIVFDSGWSEILNRYFEALYRIRVFEQNWRRKENSV